MALAGDVFAVRLRGGWFGAIRILRTERKQSLVYCSTYLERKPPTLDDPRLRKIVRQHRFSFSGKPALEWIPGDPPASHFKRIGNVPPNAAERKRTCNVFGSEHWDIGDEALREWQWAHERKKLEAEVHKLEEQDERQERKRKLAQKPKYMMREERFWALLDKLDWRHTGNDDKVVKPLLQALAAASVREIKGFEERLAHCLFRIDTQPHARRFLKQASDYLSPDEFLYARCVCLVNGKDFYEKVRADPKHFPKGLEFEALLNVAADAYGRKTGKEFQYLTGCSYETYSNLRGWEPRRRKARA